MLNIMHHIPFQINISNDQVCKGQKISEAIYDLSQIWQSINWWTNYFSKNYQPVQDQRISKANYLDPPKKWTKYLPNSALASIGQN